MKRVQRSDQTTTLVWTKVNAGEAGESAGGLMSPLTTEAPRERRRLTVARPIPDEPPVEVC